ncbi:MAG: hypothetical protein WBD20_22485 [Pirellulaceae bacterium]
MSSQDPFSQDFDNQPNPYARNPYSDPGQSRYQPAPNHLPASNPLLIPAIFLIIFGGLTLVGGIMQLVGVAANGPPPAPANQDPAAAAGFKFGFLASAVAIPIMNAIVVAGSIAMIARRFYVLAMIAAVFALVPICGPCLVLGIPFGIWALILLNRPDVKASFA